MTIAIYVFCAVLLLTLVFLLIFAKSVLKIGFGKRCEGNPLLHYFTADDFDGLKAEPVEFQNNHKEALRGFFYSDEARTDYRALLIFAHGMGGGHLSYTTEIDFFAKRGYLVLAYDQTGTMASDGKALRGMGQGFRDLLCAMQFAKENEKSKNLPVLLAGHSWGGYSVCRALYFHPQVRGVLAFSVPESEPDLLLAQAKAQTGKSFAFLKPFLRFWNRLQFGAAAAMTTSEILAESDVPVLLLHGENDAVVPPENAAACSKRLHGKKNIQVKLYPGKQHNVYATLEAEAYISEVLQKFGVLSGSKESAELKAYAETLDFRKMCEEDSAVMDFAAAFLENCLTKK